MLNPYAWPADVPQFLRLRATLSPVPLLISDAPQMIRVRTVSPPLGLELHWADRSNAELGYRIERQRAAEGWELFGITGPDTIFYPRPHRAKRHRLRLPRPRPFPGRRLFRVE